MMTVGQALDTRYYSQSLGVEISLADMLRDVPLDLIPKSREQLLDLLLMFDVDVAKIDNLDVMER